MDFRCRGGLTRATTGHQCCILHLAHVKSVAGLTFTVSKKKMDAKGGPYVKRSSIVTTFCIFPLCFP